MSINFDELPDSVQKMFEAHIADNLEKQGKETPTDKENRDRVEDIKAEMLYGEDDLL